MFTKSRTKANKCAKEIANWLIENNLWNETLIYVDGGRYRFKSSLSHEDEIEALLNDKKIIPEIIYEENWEPPFEYVAKPNFLSMSFEGSLYGVLNYEYSLRYCEKLDEEFESILEKYGYYYELGNAWNLTACKL